MTSFFRYLLSIISAAFVCCILTSLFPKGGNAKLIRMLSSLFLIFQIVQPVMRVQLIDANALLTQVKDDANSAAKNGESISEETFKSLIIQTAEAYILDKANKDGIQLQAKIELSEDEVPVPYAVTIFTNTTLKKTSHLQECIETELNIPKERQQWILNGYQ